MRCAIFGLLFFLYGCGPSPAQLQAAVRGSSSGELCDAIALYPQFRNQVIAELQSRNANCDWDRVKALAQVQQSQAQAQAASDAATAQAVQGYVNSMNAQTNALNARAAAQAQSKQQINCFSQPAGGGSAWINCQ